MSRYAKAIAAFLSLIVMFAFEGEDAIDVEAVEAAISAIVSAVVWAIPNRAAA